MTYSRSLTANFGILEYTTQGTSYDWLKTHFASNWDYEDTNDADGDGVLTWQEYVMGTDPTNRKDYFRLLSIQHFANSNFIKWYATTNSGVYDQFSIWRSTNLLEGFSMYHSNYVNRASDGTNAYIDLSPPPSGTPVFYRPGVVWTNVP